jgi:hypothetical protein
MAPEAVKAFVAEFHREINRLNASKRSQAEAMRRKRCYAALRVC